MSSPVDIYNLALGKLGQDNTIASPSERSKEARLFNRLFAPTRDLVLAARNWPWALKAVALAQEQEAPRPGWQFRYARPSDCITVVAVTDESGMRAVRRLSNWCDATFRRQHGIDFELDDGQQGTSILTDLPNAWLVYVHRVEDTERYPPTFVDALAAKLAEEAAPALIGDRGFTSKPSLHDLYQMSLSTAAAHAYSESAVEDRSMPAAQAVRG